MDDQLLEREPRHSPGANVEQQPECAPARLPRLAPHKSSPAALAAFTPAEPNVERPSSTHEDQEKESLGAALIALEGGRPKLSDSTNSSLHLETSGARGSNACCEELVASHAASDAILRPGTCDLNKILQEHEEELEELLKSPELVNQRATPEPTPTHTSTSLSAFPSVTAESSDSHEATNVATPEGNQALAHREENRGTLSAKPEGRSEPSLLEAKKEERGEGGSTEAFRSRVKRDEDCREGSLGVSAAVAGEASSRLSDVREEVAMRSSHPVVELYESVRDPVDDASFDERKRRVSSSMNGDGESRASNSEDLFCLLEGLKSRLDDNKDQEVARDNLVRPGQLEGDGDCRVCQNDDGWRGRIGEFEEEEGGGAADSPDSIHVDVKDCCGAAGAPSSVAPAGPGSLSQVILKFTTVADGNEPPSFAVGKDGATVGRGSCNDISIPTDPSMVESDHASVVWKEGAFHVQDRGHPNGASIRIATGRGLRDWALVEGCMFSAGNSVFRVKEIDEDRGMLLEIVTGPLKGELRRVQRDGATVGRATENTISIADRELSRHHSTIECVDTGRFGGSGGHGAMTGCKAEGGICTGDKVEEGTAGKRPRRLGGNGEGRLEFYLCDVGSTNGTYVQLVGPYASCRRLELSDHILIGRTGFSINRFDWGVWEDRGARRTMEDKSVIIQDMGVEPLACLGLGPQTFLGVYDGHGGSEASQFLWRRLHVAVAEALEEATPRVAEALRQDRAAERESLFGSGGGAEAKRCEDWNCRDRLDFDVDVGCYGDHSNSNNHNEGVCVGVERGSMAKAVGGVWTSPSAFSSCSGNSSNGSGGTRGPGVPPLRPPVPVLVPSQHPSGLSASPAGGSLTRSSPSRPDTAAAAVPMPADATGELGSVSPSEKESHKEEAMTANVRDARSWSSGAVGVDVDVKVGVGVRSRSSSASAGGSGRGGSSSSAPCLPLEWLLGARAAAAAARPLRRGDDAGDEVGGDSVAAFAGQQTEDVVGGASDGAVAVAGAPADGGGFDEQCEGVVTGDSRGSSGGAPQQQAVGVGGGEAASGVCTNAETVGAVKDRPVGGEAGRGYSRRGVSGEDGGGAGLDGSVVAWPRRGGAQSPGGGPSRPLATAGLPAEGGGYGLKERRKFTASVDRVIERAVSQAFLSADEEFLTTSSKPSSGSTATTVMILGDRLYSFNVGDSRTILCRSGRAELVSKDHKPNREDEMERIKQAGGMVIHKRVMGELAVSRAFGDRAFKRGIKAIMEEVNEELALVNDDDDEDFDELDEDEDESVETFDTTVLPVTSSVASWDTDLTAGDMGATQHHHPPSPDGCNQLTLGRGNGRPAPPSPPPDAAPPAPTAAAAAVAAAASEAPLVAPPPPMATPPRPPAAASRGLPVTDPNDALIVARPEMLSCRITPEDEFVLLACDGLFDVFSTDEVVQVVRREMRKHGDTQRACETLTLKAINERYTSDNVSIVLVVLKKFW